MRYWWVVGSWGADGRRDFPGFFGRENLPHEEQAEVCGRTRATRGDYAAVGDGTLGGKDRRQFGGDGKMRRVAPSGEQAGVVQHDGRGADGGEPAAGRIVA